MFVYRVTFTFNCAPFSLNLWCFKCVGINFTLSVEILWIYVFQRHVTVFVK